MASQETFLTEEQARYVIEAMREVVNEVPSYVDLQAAKARQENQQEIENAA